MDTNGIGLTHLRGSSRTVVLLTLALLALALVGLPVRASSAAATGASLPAWTDGQGLHVVSATPTGDREWRLVVSTSALARPVRIDVLLPVGYADSDRRYPTLYLLHGTSGGADDWLDQGDAATTAAAYPMIVVMPDAGYDGNGGSFFTNWVDQHTSLGTANWETFHIDQLIPFVDAHLRTEADRSARAIAGLSQGGFGSMSYAARHADTFVAAAAFSGAPDIYRDPRARAAGAAVVGGIMSGLDQVEPDAPFGDQVTHALTWAGHNPASLLPDLADTDLALWSGNGTPGPLDQPGPTTTPATVGGVPIEVIVHESSNYFVQAAHTDGVPVRYRYYGAGTHSWPYWARDLREYLPQLQQVFDEHRPVPGVVGHRATEQTWQQWGWDVTNLGAPGWTGFSDASAAGFTFGGAKARVTTPADYTPGAAYDVTWTRGDGPRTLVADAQGRLALVVTAAGGTATARITAAGAAASGSSR
jgi:S-formylglutathione hydrolase FrmB